ncbi:MULTISPECIES: CbiX/SirB N-terminal domain-containing protein [unclassified Frankia]|uniref:sirohydrochlorin chelatase n=1 Tax=unclassified Frankia TaxID=2632575 RepID=UPI002AD35BEF|nr:MULTISPECIES: CbiX/SirB N-terminal domain-containing protein [unclassified Frankia]
MRGLLVIGHGSRRDDANATVRAVARLLAQPDRAEPDHAETIGAETIGAGDNGQARWGAVEPAFLELAQPDIVAGYGILTAAGCTEIVVHPFFLFEGNHTTHDIPAALARAQEQFPDTRWCLTAPLGLHPGVLAAVAGRIEDALTGDHPGNDQLAGNSVSAGAALSAIGPR